MIQHSLMSLAAASELIGKGAVCCVAGDESALRRLPRGCWIGGTIPYFMTPQGGKFSRDEVFVSTLPGDSRTVAPKVYTLQSLHNICREAPEHGFTMLLMPAFSAVLQSFAEEAANYEDMFLRPLFGWVAGIHFADLGQQCPFVFDGLRGEVLADAAVVLHVPLPPSKSLHIDIVNPFIQRESPVIEVPQRGFIVGDCLIGGQAGNLHDHLVSIQHDIRVPLQSDHCGALVNVSIRQLLPQTRQVEFFTPVFPGFRYRPAQPVGDYVAAFDSALANHEVPGELAFACNCALNYLYGELEGRILPMQGPATFGEIAYQLLNQTLVHASLVDNQ